MKKLLIWAALLSLAACNMPTASPPATSTVPLVPTEAATATLAPESTGTMAAEIATYRDDANGFELDYPAGWTNIGGEGGSRGAYIQIVSWENPSSSFDQIPEGGTLLQIAVYQWEPVRDLDARVDMRRRSITDSGNSILEENTLTLASGVIGVRMLVQSSQGESLFFFTTLDDRYLELSGDGDIAALDAIVQTLRIDGVGS